MKASDYIVKFLESKGIEYVFGYQGGMITHLVDSLSKSKKVKFVQCYHEQSAAFAAEGYARASGKFGVCITTSGPGATNIVTGIGSAYFDSVPVLYITGQVNSFEYKYDSPIRQKGFQETDIVSIAKPICKRVALCDDPKRLADELANSLSVMLGGRKGPALIDLPMNVQRADVYEEGVVWELDFATTSVKIDEVSMQAAVDAMSNARKPLIICGGGLADAKVNACARSFVMESGCPYVVSLMGKGLVDETDSLCVGMIGSYGNRCANLAFAEADVVLSLGSRLDLRQTGNRNSDLLKDKMFIRVDIDGEELREASLPKQVGINMDVVEFCAALADMGGQFDAGEDWKSRVQELKYIYSQKEDVRCHAQNPLPYEIMDAILSAARDDALFVADVGQNQMWAAQTIRCGARQRFYTSGGMAPMGYAIPAAVGAAFANPGRQIVCFCGDGGFHIAVQSLMLISQYRLPIAVVVFNNHALGMITQFQSLYFNSNFAGTVEEGGYCVPDLRNLASAYGLMYYNVSLTSDISGDILNGPCIVEIAIEGLTTVVPKLEFNKGLNDMSPQWKSDRSSRVDE